LEAQSLCDSGLITQRLRPPQSEVYNGLRYSTHTDALQLTIGDSRAAAPGRNHQWMPRAGPERP